LTNPPGHLWRDKWTTLSGPLSHGASEAGQALGASGPHVIKSDSQGQIQASNPDNVRPLLLEVTSGVGQACVGSGVEGCTLQDTELHASVEF
jgi:hypothetical protein